MGHEALKLELEQRLAVLQERLRSIKRDVTRKHSDDSAEQAQERENDEVIDAIGNEVALSIRQIRTALDRIEEGDYGQCERCGSEITQGRLEALPEARYCVSCAE